MEIVTTLVLAAVFLAAAGYAQHALPRFTATRAKTLAARGILAAVGLAFGYVVATLTTTGGLAALVAFLIGFGAVHLPAAVILLIKRERGSGPS